MKVLINIQKLYIITMEVWTWQNELFECPLLDLGKANLF